MPKSAGAGQARTLTPDQLEQLLEAAPSPVWRACWAIQRFTGSRISETLALRWGAIHNDRITFRSSTTKTRTTREPRIGPRLALELAFFRSSWVEAHGRQPRSTDLVFPGRNPGEPLTRAAADLALRQACQALGPDFPTGVSLHSFRRSLATTMAQGGASLKTVARFTGHQSLQQLQGYIDVAESDELAALALVGG
ncbi:MAG: hypothetical protein RLZZ106_137 [Cyanobacteriota bacterium]|jgi:integrase/recombinase XerD